MRADIMKRHMRLLIALAMLGLAASVALGIIMANESAEIVFEKGKVPEGVTWERNLALTDAGLAVPAPEGNVDYELWVQTQMIPPGYAWRPPGGVQITLAVFGSGWQNTPIEAYVRYGCDAVHWSTWYRMPEGGRPAKEALKTYEYDLALPRVAVEPYQEIMLDWMQNAEPNWSSDEDEFCRWLAKKDPDFFAREIPVIGYLQFRLEYGGVNPNVKIKSMSIEMGWGTGGINGTSICARC